MNQSSAPPPNPDGQPPRQPGPTSPNELYRHCWNGYQYRDQLIPQEFWFMSQVFMFLLPVMAAARAVNMGDERINDWGTRILAATIGFAGFIALCAYIHDLRANASCKRVLRSRMVDMEVVDLGQLPSEQPVPPSGQHNNCGYFLVIRDRIRTFFDRIPLCNIPWWLLNWLWFRGRNEGGANDYSATRLFLFAAHVYVVVWLIAAIMIVVGPKLTFPFFPR